MYFAAAQMRAIAINHPVRFPDGHAQRAQPFEVQVDRALADFATARICNGCAAEPPQDGTHHKDGGAQRFGKMPRHFPAAGVRGVDGNFRTLALPAATERAQDRQHIVHIRNPRTIEHRHGFPGQ